VWAAPAGVLAATLGVRVAWSVPALWALGLCLVAPVPPRVDLALACLVGLFAAGLGLGRCLDRQRSAAVWSGAGAVFLGGALASALPALGGVAGEAPWSPAWAAGWLDLSPVALVVEVSGLDWMRHAAVYAPVGADSIGPELRQPHGTLAGMTVLLVGCTLGCVGAYVGRGLRDHRQTHPED